MTPMILLLTFKNLGPRTRSTYCYYMRPQHDNNAWPSVGFGDVERNSDRFLVHTRTPTVRTTETATRTCVHVIARVIALRSSVPISLATEKRENPTHNNTRVGKHYAHKYNAHDDVPARRTAQNPYKHFVICIYPCARVCLGHIWPVRKSHVPYQ